MAERRMFSKKITDGDAFTALPPTTQALYFHLCMGADDDGFNNKIRQAMFNAHADQNDFNLLVQHRFIIPFDSKGVIVIKHWKLHNIIRSDRYHKTEYIDEKSSLILKENGVYTENDNQVTTKWQPSDNQMEPEVRLGKDRLGKDSIDNTPLTPLGDKPKATKKNLTDQFKELVNQSELSEPLKNKIKEWIDYKNDIKKPYKTERGFKQFLAIVSKNSLNYSDDEIIEVINKTMASEYQGVVWEWLTKNKTFSGSSYMDAISNRVNIVDDWV